MTGGLKKGVSGLVVAAYPLLVFLALRSESRGVLLCLALLLGAGAFLFRSERTLLITALSVGAATLLQKNELLLYHPVLMNLLFFLVFASSIVSPPTIPERFARMQCADLPPEGVEYCRKVSFWWCGFFLCNGAVALGTVLGGSLEVWTLYNGFISYLLIGAMFGGEYLVRRSVMRGVSRTPSAGNRSTAMRSVAVTLFSALVLGTAASARAGSNDEVNDIFRDQWRSTAGAVGGIAPALTVQSNFRAQFTQRKFIPHLTKPMVSRGELSFEQERGVVWRVVEPFESEFLVRPGGISRRDEMGAEVEIHGSKAIEAFSQVFLALFAGDLKALENHCSFWAKRDSEGWHVGVLPKDARLAKLLSSVVIRGTDVVRAVTIREEGGDVTELTFSNTVFSEKPTITSLDSVPSPNSEHLHP